MIRCVDFVIHPEAQQVGTELPFEVDARRLAIIDALGDARCRRASHIALADIFLPVADARTEQVIVAETRELSFILSVQDLHRQRVREITSVGRCPIHAAIRLELAILEIFARPCGIVEIETIDGRVVLVREREKFQ